MVKFLSRIIIIISILLTYSCVTSYSPNFAIQQKGNLSTPKSLEKIQTLKKAFKAGNKRAALLIGKIYFKNKNYKEAKRWLLKAILNG